jgi:hypothetical protein
MSFCALSPACAAHPGIIQLLSFLSFAVYTTLSLSLYSIKHRVSSSNLASIQTIHFPLFLQPANFLRQIVLRRYGKTLLLIQNPKRSDSWRGCTNQGKTKARPRQDQGKTKATTTLLSLSVVLVVDKSIKAHLRLP